MRRAHAHKAMLSKQESGTSVVLLPVQLRTASRTVATFALTCAVGACAVYTPKPLSERTDLATRLPLSVDVGSLGLPVLQRHSFDPGDGLDMTETAMLAVVNNPDLRVQRSKLGVAQAQLFQARLLPDPQISASLDHPTDHGPGLTDGYSVGLGYDLAALITRGASVDAQRAAHAQVSLQTVWQEWQTVQKARDLYTQTVVAMDKLALQRQARDLYRKRYQHSAAALRRGDATLDVVSNDLAALANANTQVNDAERALNQHRHDLRSLLGLVSASALNLEGLPERLPAAAQQQELDITAIARRRPDLVALQQGYRSQEAMVHKAVLAQFPSLTVNLNQARDTSAVHTVGIGVSLNLPLFSANRGEIAVQRATREQLRQEYQARLDATAGEIDALQDQATLVRRQLQRVEADLPLLQRMATETARQYDAGNLDGLIYLGAQNALLNKQSERLDLLQTLWQTRISLDTLTAWPDAA